MNITLSQDEALRLRSELDLIAGFAEGSQSPFLEERSKAALDILATAVRRSEIASSVPIGQKWSKE